jgi:hypothetical protein
MRCHMTRQFCNLTFTLSSCDTYKFSKTNLPFFSSVVTNLFDLLIRSLLAFWPLVGYFLRSRFPESVKFIVFFFFRKLP